jgi:hypothetical protein
MPRTKWKLTKHEQFEHASSVAWLRTTGIDIRVPKLASVEPLVDLQIEYAHNFIFNSSPDHMTLVIDVRLLPRRDGIYLEDNLRVSLPWEGPLFELWYRAGRESDPYRIPPCLSYRREDVLNEQLAEGIRLTKGKVVKGTLLLIAWDEQLPEQYRHGEIIDVGLSLFDTLGREFTRKTKIQVDRAINRPQPKKQNQTPAVSKAARSGLYGGEAPFDVMEDLRRRGIESSKPKPPKPLSPGLELRGTEVEQAKQLAEYLKQQLALWRQGRSL